MNKKLMVLAGSAVLCALVSGCNSGSTVGGTPTISAIVNTSAGNNNSCTGLTSATSCTINLTWNTNGATNPSFYYTSNPSPLPTPINTSVFTTSLQGCQSQVAAGTTQCSFTVTYNGGYSSTQLNFTLSNGSLVGTSNTIVVSGT